ncbi:ShlB/FhaC/HecB family hemolysin secretion/activation protein [Oceanicoccus sp. KOV_DT_Chl]|uniref:ShlB/FhaC/HecB family hemolysin secretion/activation protein n=1 Tax=Oceanicoccus sp. KOV_DT_Chl TaxID=1904639 RepID=UPI0013578285|nr:ShlB/FhaC/HecB family hemolysin secretion/activation protein [Oceanicoccus sp. KOV_DT_Chl]
MHKHNSANIFTKHLAISTLVASSLLTTLPSYAQVGAVSPGAVQPQLDRPQLPTTVETPEYTVPPVIDRPLGIEEGPSIEVKQFHLRSEDMQPPEIDQSAVTAILDRQRQAHADGFTIGQLQQVANEVTQYYRQQGFILAQAYIPQQNVENGLVTVSVLTGRLGEVTSEKNTHFSDQLMIKALDFPSGSGLQQQPMETALLRLNDLPGLKASGIFRPGSNIGEADLILNVEEENVFDGYVLADNYGVDSTGKERLLANANWNNPTGRGDRLTVTALQTFDPSDSLYGGFRYETPLFSRAFTLGVQYNNNDYTIGQQAFNILELEGDTEQTSIYGRYSIERSRLANTSTTISLTRKKAELETANQAVGEDNLTVLKVAYNFDSTDTSGIHRASMAVSKGFDDWLGAMDDDGDDNSLRIDKDGNYVGGDFVKLNLNYTRLQSLAANQSLLVRFETQQTNDVLSSLEQFSMGGPNSVRAYPVSEYIRDSAVFTSIEWIINAPGFANTPAFGGRNWGEILKVSLFADYANGDLNNAPSVIEDEIEISGAGISVDLRLADSFFARLDVATPLSSRDASNDDDPQVWLTTGFNF